MGLDSLQSYFSINKFQYDTPDTINFDDRDELRINTSVIASRKLGSYLKLKALASVNLYHMVYIFGERSADNNWNRIFRLQTYLDYHPLRTLQIKQGFEVLANYVDYDYEPPNTSVRSFVFRKFSTDDSIHVRLSNRSSFDIDYRLQLDEHGRLFWDNWTEQMLVTRKSHWFRISYRYTLTPSVWFSPGFSLYRRDEWRHSTDPFGVMMKEKASALFSRGPAMRFFYVPSSKVRVQISATRLAVDAQNQNRYFINNIDLQLYWYF